MNRTPFSKKRNVRYPMEEHAENTQTYYPVISKREPLPAILGYKLKPQLKQTPFTKKHKVVHKVEDPNKDEKLALIMKAVELRSEIFKARPCVLCLLNFDRNTYTYPHHILNKGNYDRLRFVLTNLLPLCWTHHIQYAHDNQRDFRHFLLDRYPRHYRVYLNERDNRKPVRQTVESLTKIVAGLQYYADHPLEAEQVIYEKD